MYKYLIAAILCLPICITANAQRSRTMRWSSETPNGIKAFVFDGGDKNEPPLSGAQVMMIMGKDTIRMKTDRNGEVFYTGPLLADLINYIVSYPGYESRNDSTAAPKGYMEIFFGLKKEVVPDTDPESAPKPDGTPMKDYD